jgi:hypothetical protein
MIRGPQKPRAIRNYRGLLSMHQDGWDLKYMKCRHVQRLYWPWPKEPKRFRDFCRSISV